MRLLVAADGTRITLRRAADLRNWTPNVIPNDGERTFYIVVDDFGDLGRAFRETDAAAADFQTTVRDLLHGQYRNPVRVIAFNTLEGWSRDVSADIAQELRRRCDLEMIDPQSNLQDFLERHEGRDRQLQLRLA